MRHIVPLLREVERLATEGKLAEVNEIIPDVTEEFAVIKQFFINCPATAAAA